MPAKVQVRINTVGHITRGEYNLIEVTGYDETNRSGFKKSFFAEKKEGGATVNAQIAESLTQDDWAEFTLDDTSYHNVQSIRAIGAPANASAPAQSGGSAPASSGGSPASGGGGAKKTGRSVGMLNRGSALEAAVKLTAGEKPTKGLINTLEKLAYRMEAFLSKGSFDADVDAVDEPVAPEVPVAQPDNTTATQPPVGDAPPAPEDDDIPF
jgi:hypothetical protein